MKTGDIFTDEVDLKLGILQGWAMVELYTVVAGEPVTPGDPETPFYFETGDLLVRSTVELPGAGEHPADWSTLDCTPGGQEWEPAHDGLNTAIAELPAGWLDGLVAEAVGLIETTHGEGASDV